MSRAALQRFGRRLRPYLLWMRLERPGDLMLLIWPLFWASWLASEGTPDFAALALLLLASVAVRCAAWLFNDLMEARLLRIAPESYVANGEAEAKRMWRLLFGLLLLALLLLLPLPTVVLAFAPGALLVPLAYPFLKQRTYLVQFLLAIGMAWVVPIAYAGQGASADKQAWLLYVATVLWATAGQLLIAVPRVEREAKVGIRSLAQLFGPFNGHWVLALQVLAVVALWLLGRQLELGVFFSMALLVLLALSVHQQVMLFGRITQRAMRVYHHNHWWALALLCGFAFDFLCICATPT